MEKKKFSVIGTCVSRELFNTLPLSEYACVETYLFQRCIWDMKVREVKYGKEIFDGLNAPAFSVRMLEYSLNGTALDKLKENPGEYLIIDLYNLRSEILRLTNGEEVYYFQNTTDGDAVSIKELSRLPEFSDLKLEKLGYSFEGTPFTEGIEYFAHTIKEIYDEEKIIIHLPCHAKKCFVSGTIKSYPEVTLDILKSADERVANATEYLITLLPRAKVLRDGEPVAAFALCDEIKSKDALPPAIHHALPYRIEKGCRVLELLGIDVGKTLDVLLAEELLCESERHARLNDENRKYKRSAITLNNYFDKIRDKNKYIIIITAKDDASNRLKYFRNRSTLPLKYRIGFRDAYIGIVDSKRNFVYEKVVLGNAKYSYSVNDRNIEVESAGFDSGNISRVIVDGGNNVSRNRRGLNIVLLDSETLEVVDSVNCDTFGDAELLINSSILSNPTL